MWFRSITRHKSLIIYGASLAVLLFVLRWLELRLIVINYAFELYILAIAFIFMGIGIWLALKLARPKIKTVVVEKEVFVEKDTPFALNEKELDKLNLSKRELEVLQLMATGLSNQEIADQLFVSLNTIKTHSSRLFEKLEVSRRTQAVEKARKLSIIP